MPEKVQTENLSKKYLWKFGKAYLHDTACHMHSCSEISHEVNACKDEIFQILSTTHEEEEFSNVFISQNNNRIHVSCK